MKGKALVISMALLVIALGIGYLIIDKIIQAKKEQAVAQAAGEAVKGVGGFIKDVLPFTKK